MNRRKLGLLGVAAVLVSGPLQASAQTSSTPSSVPATLPSSSSSDVGTIVSVAGDGTRGFAGDGGPATSAHMSEVSAVAVDRFGNLFIADYGSHRVRKVDNSGIITTIAGIGTAGFAGDGGPAASAQLN